MNKNFLIIFLAATAMFFCVAQKVKADTCSAVPASGVCDSASGQKACYCSKTSASADDSKNTISNLGATLVCCSQYVTACTTACTDGGYVSRVLVNPSRDKNDYTYNALSNLKSTPTSTTTTPAAATTGGIVPCGKSGQSMCTLCDLFKGFNTIIQYIMKISIGVALLVLAIGGVLYTISAGESSAMETAKSAIKNAAVGFVIILAAWLIINTTMQYMGTIKNAAGEPTLGITITKWGEFDCTANPNR